MSITVYKLPEAELLKTEVITGQILYATDTKKVYYDNVDGVRMLTSNIISFRNITEMNLCDDPRPDKVYLLLSTSILYRYAGEWIELNDFSQVMEVLFECTILTPIVMHENDIPIAPATIASNVYTSDGRTVEALFAEIISKYNFSTSKLKIETTNKEIASGQKIISIPYPFSNYTESGNTFIVCMKLEEV